MRIMVILPLAGGSLSIGESVAAAYTQLGHLVEVFQAPKFQSTFEALRGLQVDVAKFEQLQASLIQVVSEAIYARVETFHPDLVFSLAQAPLTRQVLKRLQRDKVRTAMWFVEDYQLFPYWRSLAPAYDFFFTIQKEPILSLLQELGCSAYLPLAANPNIHCPTQLTSQDKLHYGAEVSFMGAGYPNRRATFKQLVQTQPLKIWGSDWDDEPVLQPYIQENGRRISTAETSKIFNATQINLNLHSSILPQAEPVLGDFVNPRTFELAACRAFQLLDQRTLLPELFTSQELITFDSLSDLKAKIHYYLAHPQIRQELATQAYARVLRDHTYAQRMQAALDFMHQHIPWTEPKFTSLAQALTPQGNLTPDLDAALKQLLPQLNLPPTASWETLMAKLETTTPLNSLGSTLLLVDAWRKTHGAGNPVF